MGGKVIHCPAINNVMTLSVCPSLTSVDADKRAFGYVIQTADAPAFVLGFKELQAHLQAVLHQSVGAHLGAAFTPLVTLVDPEREGRAQTLSQVLWRSTEMKDHCGRRFSVGIISHPVGRHSSKRLYKYPAFWLICPPGVQPVA